MFQQLQPLFPRPPTPSISHLGSIIDETAIAKRVTDTILPHLAEMIEKAVSSAFNLVNSAAPKQPSLAEMIEKAVSSAFNAVNSAAPKQQSNSIDTEPCLVNPQTPTSPHQIIHRSKPVEINVLDDDEEQPPSITISAQTPHINSASTSPIHTLNPICGSQQAGIIIPNSEPVHGPNIMAQALHKIQVLTGNPTATWKFTAQKTAMQAVLKQTNDVLALLCTGGGKSMLAIVPSLLEKHSITVVVLPLKSLNADYIRKLDEMDVPYEQFSSSSTRISGTKNLVLVSVDRARLPQWRQALAEVNLRVKVARLVVDEGQLALTADDYRDALKDLYELRQFQMQLVVFSGTLQPISEPALMDTFGMAKSTIIIRTPTVRPELQYILEKPKNSNKDISRRVLQIIHHHSPQMSPSDRVLIFVPYIEEGEILASLLGCKFYNGGKDITDMERQSAYDSWIKGSDQIMICTAAFGAGNDYPHVRLVIHAGTPREMIGCIQEKSRAGRDGQPAKCYFLPGPQQKMPEIPPGEIDHKGQVAIYKWLYPTKPICLRYGLTIFCDGKGTYCQDDSSYQKCSICQPSLLNNCTFIGHSSQLTKRPAKDTLDEAYHISKQRKIDKEAQSFKYVDRMKHSLEYFNNICPYCKVHGIDAPKHSILGCPQLIAHDYKHHSSYINWRNSISYKSYHSSICYFCHVPQCHHQLHGPFVKGSTKGCIYPDVIGPVVYAIAQKPALLSRAGTYFNQQWRNSMELITWLNGKPSKEEKSNTTALFSWYYTAFCTITH